MCPKSGLLIQYKWCRRIFSNGKVWEIRSKNCHKRGRIGIICTKSSSPSKKALLLGEATLARSFKVADVQNGVLVPPPEAENFIFHPVNQNKHQVTLANFGCLKKYKAVYAWELCDVTEYEKPKPVETPRGTVVWAGLA